MTRKSSDEDSAQSMVVPSEKLDYYGDVIYYNSFEQYLNIQNELITGDSSIFWLSYFKNKYGIFDRALYVNCGNGWVERSMFAANVIKRAVGIDISKSSIEAAVEEAAKIGMSCEYLVMDINQLKLDESMTFDLVVNYGAMHHVAYINKVTRTMREHLSKDGIYLTIDYVGPHRNQYPWPLWSKIVEINERIPTKFRANLVYPHLKTMLVLDPTEAIHSELQIDILQRYFHIEEYKPLGGGICHPILYQHRTLFEARGSSEGKEVVEMLFAEDRKLLQEMPESNLFSFAVAKPKDPSLDDISLIKEWQNEEDAREQVARENGGRYYPVTALEIIYNELEEVKCQLKLLPSGSNLTFGTHV